ncbi:hypothetical protein [Streptomyces sp. CB01580]|uniref:hypothetical protein n=1 Tax=Streptomyces sp. CB01580 TaxID=1703933 RepID=UPI00093CF5B3|nr:hypothetical protein [Streptomyces sp. CB01580]OKJ27789.1 hypothetical protein AMK22_29665 [Streptomyces sp. CB01580]
MAGTGDAVTDDDALYVLTAALLTPAQFPTVLGDDYPAACAELALEPYAEGYGLVLGQDAGGARWTVVVDDVSLVAVAIAAWDCGMEYDLSPDDRSMVCALPGWPLGVAVAAPGLAAPHDPPPAPDTGGRGPVPLAPPASGTWGPAQRRMGADEIAHQWTSWREQLDDTTASVSSDVTNDGAGFGSGSGATTGTGAGPGDETGAAPGTGTGVRAREESRERATHGVRDGEKAGGEHGAGAEGPDATAPTAPPPVVSHAGLRRALTEAHAYLDAPPPPGRIRSSFAAGDSRMLRIDGPGWSMVARTDDMAFVLLDDEPGEVFPVGRGAQLPGLLEALDAIAVRPV